MRQDKPTTCRNVQLHGCIISSTATNLLTIMINIKHSGQRAAQTLPVTIEAPTYGAAAALAAKLGLSMVIPTVAYAGGSWIPAYTPAVSYKKHRHFTVPGHFGAEVDHMGDATIASTMPDAFGGADRLATNSLAAAQYLLARRADACALMEDGIDNLPYAMVERHSVGMTVEGKLCATELCATAFILVKWW